VGTITPTLAVAALTRVEAAKTIKKRRISLSQWKRGIK
jgi:hypothetical protein